MSRAVRRTERLGCFHTRSQRSLRRAPRWRIGQTWSILLIGGIVNDRPSANRPRRKAPRRRHHLGACLWTAVELGFRIGCDAVDGIVSAGAWFENGGSKRRTVLPTLA